MVQRMNGRHGLQQDDFSRIYALLFCVYVMLMCSVILFLHQTLELKGLETKAKFDELS